MTATRPSDQIADNYLRFVKVYDEASSPSPPRRR